MDEQAEALEFLAECGELIQRSLNEMLNAPDIPSARDVLRAEAATKVRPLIEARREAVTARLRWSLWNKLATAPPEEVLGTVANLTKRAEARAAEADNEYRAAASKAWELEADEEMRAALLLLHELDGGGRPWPLGTPNTP